MGNGRKQRAVWTCLVQGILLSLGIYLALLLLVTLLVVKGALGEDAAFPALAVSCGAAALAGGGCCVRGAVPGEPCQAHWRLRWGLLLCWESQLCCAGKGALR